MPGELGLHRIMVADNETPADRVPLLLTVFMVDWNIQSRADACEACKKTFSDKEVFHTLLFDRKDSYQRSDICNECWTTQYGQGATDRKGFVSCWQSVFAVPPPPEPEPIQKETAESLLRKLIENRDPSHEAALFILAVMLERKRLLKVKAQLTEEGRRIFVYEHSKSGDLFHIADPNLQLAQLEKVQRDVASLLENGGELQKSTGSPEHSESDESSTQPPEENEIKPPPEAGTEAAIPQPSVG